MNFPGQKVPNMVMERSRYGSRRNEEAEPQQKQHPVVEVSGSGSKADVEQYCIGNWNVRSMVN